MSGNVWEFCSDSYAKDYYATSPDRNPQGAAEGPHIVKRGGSWSINPRYLRATVRGRAARDDAHYSSGFRVAVSATF
jgi:formylglycine-generating enzyme required for sulfatase activity